jgi:TonB family protein
VNEAVDRVLVERERGDRGFSTGFGISAGVHGAILLIAVALPLIFPPPPPLQIAEAFAVPLPPGGRGNPSAKEVPPAPQQAAPQPAPPVTTPAAPEPPPKIIKPPKEEPRQGLPEPDAKPVKPERRAAAPAAPTAAAPSASRAVETKGLSFAPAGAGIPGGTDPNGDYYLAGVQRKIWSIWNQQLRGGAQPAVTVSFTITADGSVTDVQPVQSSGIYTVDAAAQRAIQTAAPFAPLPKSYGTNAYTIRAVFKPET